MSAPTNETALPDAAMAEAAALKSPQPGQKRGTDRTPVIDTPNLVYRDDAVRGPV